MMRSRPEWVMIREIVGSKLGASLHVASSLVTGDERPGMGNKPN